MNLEIIKGLSDKRIADLKKMQIYCVEDLISHFPRNYLDLTKCVSIAEAYHNEIVLTAAKVVTKPQLQMSSGRKKYVKVYCEQNGVTFSIVWFNQPYVEKQLSVDSVYLFYGRVQNKFGMISMTNPSFELADKNFYLKGLVPVYSLKGNLTQKVLRDSIFRGLSALRPTSIIPEYLINKYSLSNLDKAYYDVHLPKNVNAKQNASERIAVEEYFKLISAFKIIKGDNKTLRQNKYIASPNEIKEFTKRFGFELTDGQKNAINEIFSDMRGAYTMNRLIQGDVGSGKTVVALCSIYLAVKSGYQAVFLAPTEVLAKQNFNLIQKYFPEKSALLIGSLTAGEKKNVKQGIKLGEYKIIVGTHAVLQSDVEFCNLSLCVCDEQQRFGVGQRTSLLSKGCFPDLLVMSATPIPRTLSLIVYGDLDISIIHDKPKQRKEVKTFIVKKSKYQDMLGFIDDEAKKGNQTYFVCPKIDEDEEGTLIGVTELYDELSRTLNSKVAILHGKMKDSEKEQIMSDFKSKKYDVLVSTTVIEVGVDVPDATVMVIHNAERFGLSQLHQLRGRIGRSDKASYCFLLSDSNSETAVQRLNILRSESDGFKIAEYDYSLRGGGDFLGVRQSGKFIGQLGALNYSTASIYLAKKLVDEAFEYSENISAIRNTALSLYEKLKDVSLN